MTDEYLTKVIKIAEYKYDISYDVLENYLDYIQDCWYNNFTPIRTVEAIANDLYG